MSITAPFSEKIAKPCVRDGATLVLELIKKDCPITPQEEEATATRNPSMFREVGRMSSGLSIPLDDEGG